MIGIGATLFKVPTMHGSRAAGFNPATLFASGEEGAWYDPSDLSTMFQNSDGTGAPVVDSPVGYIADKSGNGNHAIQATSDKRPTLRQSGSLYYLEYDGANNCLATSAIDFTGTDEMTVFTGAKKIANTTMVLAELATSVGAVYGAFRLASLNDVWRWGTRGNGLTVNVNASTYGANSTSVITAISDISTPVATIRVDGVRKATSSTTQGSGNFGNHVLNVGARNNGATLQLEGHIYGMIVRAATSSSEEISSTEAYMATKTGVTL